MVVGYVDDKGANKSWKLISFANPKVFDIFKEAKPNSVYEVTTAKAAFSTVAASSGAVLDNQATAGDTQMIYNGGANALTVYPPSGAKINGLATNAGMLLATNTACEFYCLSTTQWTGVLSA